MAQKIRPRVAFHSRLSDIKSMIEAREFLKDIHDKYFPNGEISYRQFCYYVKELELLKPLHSPKKLITARLAEETSEVLPQEKGTTFFHSPTLQNRDEVY